MKGYPVHYERQRHRTETSRRDTSNIVPKRQVVREVLEFALHPVDVKLGTEEFYRISQSLAMFHGDWLNKLFRPNYYAQLIVSVMASGCKCACCRETSSEEASPLVYEQTEVLAIQKAYRMVKKVK